MRNVEASLQRRAIAIIKAAGGYTVNHHGSSFSANGVPDLLVCWQGKFIALELKQPKQNPTLLQRHHLDLIAKAGGEAYVVRSIEGLEQIFQTPKGLGEEIKNGETLSAVTERILSDEEFQAMFGVVT